MNSFSGWLKKAGIGGRLGRKLARRRSAAAWLETLERRWNLTAVLVVETVDAYWLIEDPTFDSPAQATSAANAGSTVTSGTNSAPAVDLPSAVAPVSSTGATLNAAQSNLTYEMLDELWNSEPDFYYEDVMAVTFYSNTTMDKLIASGLLDGGASDTSNNVTRASGQGSNANAINTQALTPVSQSLNTNGVNPVAANNLNSSNNSKGTAVEPVSDSKAELIAAAKAEIASWSRRLETEVTSAANGTLAVGSDEVLAAVLPRPRLETEIRITESARQVANERTSELSPESTSVARGQVTVAAQPTEPARELTKLELFFARFPALFGSDSTRSPMLRLARGESKSSADQTSDDTTQEDSNEWSYSQWASLLGVASLSAASLWPSVRDRDEERMVSVRAKTDRKHPVVC